ncbi:MAG: hypothetical protein NVSMB10_15630 [Steroidobacteraceae bacterium]|nr:hypothetical protein [Pseudomonadota bacterium]
MSERVMMIDYTGVDRRASRQQAVSGSTRPVSRRRGDHASGRHAAITNKLPTWHSYRSWAYKVRGSFEQGK